MIASAYSYAAHKRQAVERDEQARGLAEAWKEVVTRYDAALPAMERDPVELAAARGRLLRFGRLLRNEPEGARALLDHSAAFGMDERPNLKRVLASPEPERVIGAIMTASETAMRTWLREQEAARQRDLEAQRSPAPSRGPSMR